MRAPRSSVSPGPRGHDGPSPVGPIGGGRPEEPRGIDAPAPMSSPSRRIGSGVRRDPGGPLHPTSGCRRPWADGTVAPGSASPLPAPFGPRGIVTQRTSDGPVAGFGRAGVWRLEDGRSGRRSGTETGGLPLATPADPTHPLTGPLSRLLGWGRRQRSSLRRPTRPGGWRGARGTASAASIPSRPVRRPARAALP
jgi:hypothetical protein